jgi:hypothetical protein
MKTMGTLSTFVEPVESNIVVGRQIAAAAFLHALLSYSNFERIDFFLPNLYSCQFAHSYFQEDQFLITETGMRVLEKQTPSPVYPELATMISGEVLHHILVLCRRKPRSSAFLQDTLQAARHASFQTSLYHILWALKQGLVRLAGDAS